MPVTKQLCATKKEDNKIMKRMIALLLSMLLVLALVAGCSSKPATTPDTTTDDSTTTSDSSSTTSSEPADTSNTTDDTAEPSEPVAEPEVGGDVVIAPDTDPKWWTYTYGIVNTAMPDVDNSGLVQLPLVDEPTTITGFRSYGNASYVAEPEDILCNVWLAEQTGITMDWTHVNTTEQFQIFYASGDLTDIVVESGGTYAYTGGLDKAIEDDIYVAGNDYLQYMPNFMAYLNHSEEIRRDCVTDEGTYYFPTIKSGHEPPWTGPMVRGDWLEDLGLDTPTTYADWDEMLTLFKTEKGADAALGLSSTLGYDQMGHGLDAGYGAIGDFFAKEGTEVKYGPVEDGFREYIAMTADWYERGLINRDFMSHNMWSEGQGMVLSGSTGAYDSSVYSFSYIYPAGSDDPDLTWIPVPIAKKSDDAENPHFRNQSTLVTATARAVITTAAVDNGNDVIAAKWIDFRYSEEASFVLNYGIEGDSWNMGEDGLPHYTDIILNNPNYATSGEARYVYTDGNMGGSYYMWCFQFDQYPPETFDGYAVWSESADCDWMMPAGVTLTTAEGEAYSATYGDIQTTMQEYILKFIVGEKDIDTEWDSYVETLYGMGLQDCIDIKQAALDRYNAR